MTSSVREKSVLLLGVGVASLVSFFVVLLVLGLLGPLLTAFFTKYAL